MAANSSNTAWVHHTPYRFYLQKYPQDGTYYPAVDVEEYFKCRYVKMTGNSPTEVKNTYSEDFAEESGKKIWIPKPADLAYAASEVSITLRWRSDECGDVLSCADNFFNYVTGKKIEWHDTFRPNRYLQLLLEKAPSVETEILHQDPRFLFIKYTFTNFGGKIFKQPVLN